MLPSQDMNFESASLTYQNKTSRDSTGEEQTIKDYLFERTRRKRRRRKVRRRTFDLSQTMQPAKNQRSLFHNNIRMASNKLLLSSLLLSLLFLSICSVGIIVPQVNCQYDSSSLLSKLDGLKNFPRSGAKDTTFEAGDSRQEREGELSQHNSNIKKRASIVNSNGRLSDLAQASSQLDREEEATNGGELSTVTGIEPQSIGGTSRRHLMVGGGGGGGVEDMSTLGSELHESYPTNDNVKNTLNSASKLRIVRILAPEATQNGTQNVTMDCMFKFDKKLDQRLTVKWFFNDEVEPIYQWIPELNKRVYSDKYEQFLDKSYEVSEDVDFMLQAYKWLQLAADQSPSSQSSDTPSSLSSSSSSASAVASLESMANGGGFDLDQTDRAQIETSRKILANKLNKLAKLGGQHSRQLLDSLRAALNMEYLDWARYRALRLIKPTTGLSGRFTCSVSSLDGEDLRSTKLLVYEPAKNFTFNVNRVSAQYYNLSCRAEQVFPRPSLTLYRYRAGPLEPHAQPLRSPYNHRPRLAATLLRQEPIPGTQTQITVGLVRQLQHQHQVGDFNLPFPHLLSTTNSGELTGDLPNDITPIDATSITNSNSNSNNNWPNQQPPSSESNLFTQNYQPMVYEISSWALIDEASLSSKVVSQFECLLAIEGTGYEQRQTLALQRGWHVNSAGIAMRSTLVSLFSALASLLCLMLALVTSLLIFKVLKRYARNRVHQAKTGENNIENNSGS